MSDRSKLYDEIMDLLEERGDELSCQECLDLSLELLDTVEEYDIQGQIVLYTGLRYNDGNGKVVEIK